MNPIQESKQELEASIRYAENAIVKANQTIESMATYQEQTGREAALEKEVAELRDIIDRMGDDTTGDSVTIKQLRNQVDELKSDGARQAELIDCMRASAFDDAKTIEYLKSERSKMQDCIKLRENQIVELESKVQGQYDDIVQLERDLTVKTSQAEAWKKEAREPKESAPTMPVIPKDVAIAIFREGTLFGVEAACDEIQGETINISESGYTGDFEVSFERDIDLDDHIDFDWVRGKIGDYDEDNVTANLEGLCAKNNFECRIHGIDSQEEKKND